MKPVLGNIQYFILFTLTILTPVVKPGKTALANLLDQFSYCHLRIFLQTNDTISIQYFHYLLDHFEKSVNVAYSVKDYATSSGESLFLGKVNKFEFHRYISLVHVHFREINTTSILLRGGIYDIYTPHPKLVTYFTSNEVNDVLQYLQQLKYYCVVNYVYLVYKLLEIFKVCLTCSSAKFLQSVDNDPLSLLRKEHTDLMLGYIEARLPVSKPFTFYSCDRNRNNKMKDVVPTPDFCIMYTLGLSMNFSFGYSRRSLEYKVSYLTTGFIVDGTDLKYTMTAELKILEFGFAYQSWAFFLVKRRNGIYERAITGMFDTKLWNCLLGMYVLMRISVVVSIVLGTCLNTRFIFKERMTLFVTLLFGRCIYKLLRRSVMFCVNRQILLVNKLIWAVTLSTLISIAYKAELASFLTKSADTKYPQTLKELAKNVPRIVSFKRLLLDRDVSVLHLKHSVEIFLFSNTSENIEIKNSYKKLQDSLLFPVGGMSKFTSDIYKQSKYPDSLNQSNDVISENFAVIDVSATIKSQKNMIQLFVPSKWTSPVIQINQFTMLCPYAIMNNYIYSVFKWGMAQIYESGLLTKWTSHYDESVAIKEFYLTAQYIKEIKRKRKLRTEQRHWLGYYLATISADGKLNPKKNAKSLTFDDLKTIWILYSMLCAGITIVFLGEVIWKVKN